MQTPNYTDTQLKQALAKMLPEKSAWVVEDNPPQLCWRHSDVPPVLDTELLHLCWLVEKSVIAIDKFPYWNALTQVVADNISIESAMLAAHATWQQRVIALCKVKGIEV